MSQLILVAQRTNEATNLVLRTDADEYGGKSSVSEHLRIQIACLDIVKACKVDRRGRQRGWHVRVRCRQRVVRCTLILVATTASDASK
jgi:hypothetical protein